jgi:hypothetical protein
MGQTKRRKQKREEEIYTDRVQKTVTMVRNPSLKHNNT